MLVGQLAVAVGNAVELLEAVAVHEKARQAVHRGAQAQRAPHLVHHQVALLVIEGWIEKHVAQVFRDRQRFREVLQLVGDFIRSAVGHRDLEEGPRVAS